MIQWIIRLKGKADNVVLTDEQFQKIARDSAGNVDLGIKATPYTVQIPGVNAFTSTEVLGWHYERIAPPLSDFAIEQATQINPQGIYKMMLLHALHFPEKFAKLSEEDKFAAELLRSEIEAKQPSDEERAYRRAFRAEWFDFNFTSDEQRASYYAEWKRYATGEKEVLGYSRERLIADMEPKTLAQEAEEIFGASAQ